MPVVRGGLANLGNTRSKTLRPRSRSRKRNKKSAKNQTTQTIKIMCSWNILKAAAVALSIFLVGLILCLIGYQSTNILDIQDWDESKKPGKYKNKLSSSQYVTLQIMYNLRYVGPVVMGVGGFILLCICVVMYNEKDRVQTGQSKMISSDADIYNQAIQDYLEREENTKSHYVFLENSNSHNYETSMLNHDSLSFRSASYCSMNSSVVKFGNFYLSSPDNQQTQLIISDQSDEPNCISRDQINPSLHFTRGPMMDLAIPRIKLFQMSLRHCSSDSEDIDRCIQQRNDALIRQSTTSSSSPTLNISEYAIIPGSSEVQRLINIRDSSPTSSDNQLLVSSVEIANWSGRMSLSRRNSQDHNSGAAGVLDNETLSISYSLVA